MYWKGDSNLIVKADMDGSNASVIVRGSEALAPGIAVDPDTSRLYWAEAGSGIKSSDPEGEDVQLILQLSPRPWG